MIQFGLEKVSNKLIDMLNLSQKKGGKLQMQHSHWKKCNTAEMNLQVLQTFLLFEKAEVIL